MIRGIAPRTTHSICFCGRRDRASTTDTAPLPPPPTLGSDLWFLLPDFYNRGWPWPPTLLGFRLHVEWIQSIVYLLIDKCWIMESYGCCNFFALEKRNNSLRPVVIGSTWQRLLASLSVAEVNSDVAHFLMSTNDNFLQFTGQKHDTIQCT